MTTSKLKKTNTPALRFKEFKDEWVETEVGSIFNISAGGDIESEHVSHQQTNIFRYPIYANASERKIS